MAFFVYLGTTRGSAGIQLNRTLIWLSTIIITLIVGFFLFTVLISNWRTSAPPPPMITHGEFPFRLEYEIDGERFVIEDIIIAEFQQSIEGNSITNARRIWSTSLANGAGGGHLGNELSFLLNQIGDVTVTFTPGLAEYFMGDLDDGNPSRIESNRIPASLPRIAVRNPNSLPIMIYERPEYATELLEELGVILISWEYTPPIENRFK